MASVRSLTRGWSSAPVLLGGMRAASPRPLRVFAPGRSRVVARLVRLAPRAAFVAATLVLLLVGGLVAFRNAYGDRVYPGVAVGDVPVGGLDRDVARALVAERAAVLGNQTVSFTHGDRTWTAALADLGVSVNVEASLDAAHRLGREGTAFDRLHSTFDLARSDRTVPLSVRLDLQTLGRWLDTVDAEFGPVPRDAALVVKGRAVSVEPEVEGAVVDREVIRQRVIAAVQHSGAAAEPLPVVVKPPTVRIADLEDARTRIEAALARPVEVVHQDQRWQLAPEDLGRFVRQSVDPAKPGADAVTVGLDQKALAGWLAERFTAEIDRDPVDAEIGWNEGPVVVTPAEDGLKIEAEAFARDLEVAFFAGERPVPVPIPVTVTKPAVDGKNLDALGITTLLARGDSNYDGGTPERDINVEVGAVLLNNTLVPPHSEFSFNHAIGEITVDNGFVESSVVEGERVGRDIGGGICQVSTTVFRAALLAGLPITEWWPHNYRILSYEYDGWGAGYDASILQPEGDPFGGSDFRFENPTDSWLLIESWTDGVHVIVNIYGPELGYDVQFSDTVFGGPYPHGQADIEVVNPGLPAGTVTQTEWPLDSSEATFVRDVYGPDGKLLYSREFHTSFRGRGNVFQVSPDMAGQSPAAG